MAKREFAELVRIEGQRAITPDRDPAFFAHLEEGLLLALRERGRLTDAQFTQASRRLKPPRREGQV